MPVTTWASATQVERWTKEFAYEASFPKFMKLFTGGNDSFAIQRIPDLKTQRGKSVHIDLITQLAGAGVDDDGTRSGNEENIVNYEQEIVLGATWHGTLSKGPIEEKRVLYDFRKISLRLLKDWFNKKLDTKLITALEASPTRTLGADDGGTPRIDSASKSGLAAADKITVADIRLLRALAEDPYTSTHVPIKPITMKGQEYFLLVLGTESMYDLQNDSEYLQIMREAWWRGEKNPIFRDAEFVTLNNVIIHKFKGINAFDDGGGDSVHGETNLFLGAQAAVLALGSDHKWHEETVDRGKQLSIGGTLIYKVAKTKFNSIDQATIAYYTATTDLSA